MNEINNDPTKIVLDRLTFAKILDLAYDGAWEHGDRGDFYQRVPGNHPKLYTPTHVDGGWPVISATEVVENILKMNPFLEDEQRALVASDGFQAQ